MAEPQTPERRDAAEAKLFTLSEVSQRTGISMPTLQRYKKTYQDRIPSVGAGRKQRYPEHSLPVFEELRTENAGKRGRPRKSTSTAAAAASTTAAGRRRGTTRRAAPARGTGRKPGRPAAARPAAAAPARRGRPPGRPKAKPAGRRGAAAAARPTRGAVRGSARGRATSAARSAGSTASKRSSGLLTLTEISKTTGISYPTLVRYVRLYSDRLKHEGKGRARRFFPEAVEAFRTLRQESSRGGRGRAGARRGTTGARRGRPPKAAAAAADSATDRLEAIFRKRLRELEKLQEGVQKRFSDLVKGLQRLL